MWWLVRLAFGLFLSWGSAPAFARQNSAQILLEQLKLIEIDYSYSLPAQMLAWSLEEKLYTGAPQSKHYKNILVPEETEDKQSWKYKKYTLFFEVSYKENQLALSTVLPSPTQWPILYGKISMIDDETRDSVLDLDLQEKVFQIVETKPLNYFLEQEEVLEYLTRILAEDIYDELVAFFVRQMYED